jgi:hypothetical protein
MADQLADDLIKEQENLASNRGVWENHWREVAERVRPNQNFFQQRERPDGDKRNERIFDDTAPLALSKFAAAVISMSFPATQTWHKMTAHDEKVNKVQAVKLYLEQVNNILFKVRYAPQANFQTQSAETILDIGAFGTGIMLIDDVLGFGIRYKAYPLAESYIAEDAHGRVDTLHRKFQMTVHQAVTMFGMSGLSEAMQKAYEINKTQKFWFLHCVRPNDDIIRGRRDAKGMKFTSAYIDAEGRKVLSEGGFRTFPFATPRFETSPREVYGRGPAIKVLPTIKTLNEMAKTILRAAQKVVQPPIMLTDDASLDSFDVRPNALNHGYIDNNGRALAQPFVTNARVDIGLDMMNQLREAINDAFYVNLFRILVEEPQITATEAMLRAQEKGQLLAPTMGRIQSELGSVMIDRELDILERSGALPPMPRELAAAGGMLKVEYQSPLNQAQKAGAGIAIMNTIQAITPLAQVDQKVLLRFNLPQAGAELADINGVPASILRSDDEIAALEQQADQTAKMQALLQAAPVAAQSAKDFAQAGSFAGSQPNQAAPSIVPQTGG